MKERDRAELELEGVAEGWSTTYVVPGSEETFPAPRHPGLRLRVVPNESLLPGPLGQHLGALVQTLLQEGSALGISIELDTSDRTRPGEMRGGASPAEVLALYFVARAATRQAERLMDRLFDATVKWVLAHVHKDQEHVFVQLYGPDGEVLKSIEVPAGGGEPVVRI